ncbi:MAG: PHP domain-containing protein [Anaerolineae bacterium]
MLIDLHVHTSRYSSCGRGTPEEMAERAIVVGLDALVLTEHNVVWPEDECAELQARYPALRILRGIEVTTSEGDDFLVYGVTEPEVFASGMEAQEVVRQARAHDGFIVLAHPYRYRPEVPVVVDDHGVDGVELFTGNTVMHAHQRAVALHERLGVLGIAASDAHHPSLLGLYALRLPRPVATERELVTALRCGVWERHVDHAGVARWNSGFDAATPRIRQWIGEGLSDEQIRSRVSGITMTMVNGLRQGLDVHRPG